MARQLRAVAPGETAPKAKPQTVTEAAASGSYRDILVAMQARVAKAVESATCQDAALAALTRRLIEISREIEAIDAREDEEADRGAPIEDGAFDASAI